MIRRLLGAWWATPRVRRTVAVALVAIGALFVLIGVVSARWGLLVVGIVVAGLGAGAGPARIRARGDARRGGATRGGGAEGPRSGADGR
ncbi:hypothetical protein ABIQ69_01715 [Agromyces sp. G08B096]|uniref:Uncharacterized protein n=1 Tax=Agromyces sp. G08B096 TaxID=3156399 RepID=A0AAU7W8J9_9MICO